MSDIIRSAIEAIRAARNPPQQQGAGSGVRDVADRVAGPVPPYSTGLPGREHAKTAAGFEFPDNIDPYDENLQEYLKIMRERAMANPNFYFNENIARGNPSLNINAKGHRDTLRLSRLADALNNRYFMSPSRLGNYFISHSGASGEGPQHGTPFQLNPINTEEMRQMQTMRELNQNRQQREQDRQQSALDIDNEQMRADLAEMNARKNLNWREAQRRQKEIWDFGLDYDKLLRENRFRMAYDMFFQELTQLNIPARKAHIVANLALEYPEYATMLAQLFYQGPAPSQEQILESRSNWNVMSRMLDQHPNNPQLALDYMWRLKGQNMARSARHGIGGLATGIAQHGPPTVGDITTALMGNNR